MIPYNITLTTTEDLALSAVALSQQDWIDNVVHERCRIAIDEIVATTVQQCLSNGIQIPGTKEEIVALAFNQGWVKTAAEQQAQFEAESNAQLAQQPIV